MWGVGWNSVEYPPRESQFHGLHHGRRIGNLRLLNENVHVLGHDDVTDNGETVSHAHLLQNRKQ